MIRNFYLGFVALLLLGWGWDHHHLFESLCLVLAGFVAGRLRKSVPWIYRREP